MATLQSGKCFTVPTFFGMCCRSEWQERMYIYKWHEVDQTKHEIFCVHIVCNEIQVKVNLEITIFFFYLRFPYCPNFFWFGVVLKRLSILYAVFMQRSKRIGESFLFFYRFIETNSLKAQTHSKETWLPITIIHVCSTNSVIQVIIQSPNNYCIVKQI